jgi:hypothetical protein
MWRSRPICSPRARLIVPACALAVFGTLFVLWEVGETQTYFRLIGLFGFERARFPFLDSYTNLSWLDCARQGVDVFRTNPCDPETGLPMNYTPVWLLGTWTGLGIWATPWVGATHCLVFLLVLCLLPVPRSDTEQVIRLAATLSPAVAFALERGNAELTIFGIAAVGCTLLPRAGAVRWLAYPGFLLAASLKLFPAVLLALAVREPSRRCLLAGGLSVAVLAGAAWYQWDTLQIIISLVPHGSAFGDLFGAKNFGLGVATIVGAPFAPWAGLERGITLASLLGASWVVVTLVKHKAVRVAARQLAPEAGLFACAGSLLLLGAFVAAQNSNYRTIHLLLLLPALCALAGGAQPRWLRTSVKVSLAAALFILWSELFRTDLGMIRKVDRGTQQWIGELFRTDLGMIRKVTWPNWRTLLLSLFWLLREAAWWWLFITMATLAGALALRAPAIREAWALAQRIAHRARVPHVAS